MVMGWDDAAIMAAMAAASAASSYYGTSATNSANRAMNTGQMIYQTGMDNWAFARNVDMMREANQFTRHQTAQAQDFAREMSNTAYQRSRRDMLAAGLNPILAATQGGASTPMVPGGSGASGSAPVHGAPAQHRMENAIGPAVSSAMRGAQVIQGIQQTAATIDQTKAATALAAAQQEQARTQAALNSASAITEVERAGLVSAQRASELVLPSLRAAQTGAASAQGVLAREQATGQGQENVRFRDYGPRTAPADLAANVEHAGRRNAPLIRQGVDAARQGGYNVFPRRDIDGHEVVGRHNQWLRDFIQRNLR